MKKLSLLLPAVALLLLAGCGTPTVSMNYAPSSVLSLSGHASVADFKYLPPIKDPKIKPNQVRNTALGNVLFDDPVDRMFRDAVFKELRFVGVTLDRNDLVLSGEIEEFLIDDLGYSIDWTLRVKYVLTDTKSGTATYTAVKNTQRKTGKFGNPFGALNETIKVNIEELIKDPAFAAAIK